MSCSRRLNASFEAACCLPLNRDTRYIIFSDCHRGVGNGNDNFLKNEPLYLAALNDYFERGFTYVELGDGDELWENRSVERIREMHSHSFELLARYACQNRLYRVYGNHDMIKKQCDNFHSGIILEDCVLGREIFLTHGHQADVLNSSLWKLARFLVRYVWKPLEGLGFPDPTSAAKNNTRKQRSEKKLTEWAVKNSKILITGHTHRPSAGGVDNPYFNTGSCVHPGGITGIEIQNRCITVVKWSMKAGEDLTFYAAREILGSPMPIKECLQGKK